MKLPQTRRADRGAAAVEFALILPVALLIIFGIIDFGRAYNAQASLNAGVREGARVEALQTLNANCVTQLASDLNPPPDPRTGVPYSCDTSRQAGDPTGVVQVQVEPCSVPNQGDSYASVQGTYSFSYVTPVGGLMSLFGLSGLANPITLNANATFRCN